MFGQVIVTGLVMLGVASAAGYGLVAIATSADTQAPSVSDNIDDQSHDEDADWQPKRSQPGRITGLGKPKAKAHVNVPQKAKAWEPMHRRAVRDRSLSRSVAKMRSEFAVRGPYSAFR